MNPADGELAIDEEIKIKEDEDIEVEPPRLARDPGQPTAAQVEVHRRTHVPYRVWCKLCILGRCRCLQHRRSSGSAVAIVGLDYFFITRGGVKERKEIDYTSNDAINEARAKGDIVKCLVVRCSKSKAVFGHVVPCKGADEDGWVADTVVRDILWLGHTRAIIKADGEPALQALVRRVLEVARVECKDLDQLAKEDPAAYDSQSSGSTEIGVRLIRGLFRTIKLCLEARLERYIPVDHPVVAWMMEHVCLLLNTMVRGTDGLTVWARVRGRSFHQQLLGFGESVLYRYPGKGPKHAPDGNMGALGAEGVFVGYNPISNTFVVITETGKVEARSVTRRPESERWQLEKLSTITALPGGGRERVARPRLDQPATEIGPAGQQVRPPQLRQLRINTSDLKRFAHYDGNCAQCRRIEKYGQARPGGHHTDACRKALSRR